MNGAVYAFAQTPDGYLWMGTPSGVIRYDGVRAVPLQLAPGQRLPSTAVWSLLAARDGTLWIGTPGGLASWKNGRLSQYPALTGYFVEALLEDREGTVWAGAFGTVTAKLCAIRNGSTNCSGSDGRLGLGVTSLSEDRDGTLWVGASTGVWRWKPGPPSRRMPEPITDRQSLAQGDDRSGVVVAVNNLREILENKVLEYPLHGVPSPVTASNVFRDRSGALWIGTRAHGLVHSYQGKTSIITHNDGLTSDQVFAVFEDREGIIWVATDDGLDRFQESPVSSLSEWQGLSSAPPTSILAARDGSMWIGTMDGLKRWKDGRMAVYRTRNDPGVPGDLIESLFEDERGRVWVSGVRGLATFEQGRFTAVPSVPAGDKNAIASDNHGGLWLSLWLTPKGEGLAHLSNGRITEQISWQDIGGGPGSGLVPDPDGGVWTGLITGGMAHFSAGRIQKLQLSKQGAEPRVLSLFRGRDGAFFAATEDGLARIMNGRVAMLTTANGLPCNSVHWIAEDDLSSYWLYTRCGLLRIARTELDAWTSDPKRTVQSTLFEGADGIQLIAFPSAARPAVAKSSDGKIWFLNGHSVSAIDPSQSGLNKIPPPVHIEQIIADDKPYQIRPEMRLPANVRNLRIEFTALSLVAPEKTHFRYKLEGQNRNWHEVINERHVTYTNLAPHNYSFHVMASNNSGVWNETGDTLEFSITPAYYETTWFLTLCAAAAIAMLWAGYQFRLRQVRQESKRLRDVIETIPSYAWSALPDGAVDFVNRSFLNFTGLVPDRVLRWGWEDAVHPEDRDRLVEAWRAAIASGTPLEAEARMRSADGQYRWLLLRSVPLRDDSGKILKWYGNSTDIDERKRAEEELYSAETRFRAFVDHATDAFFVLEFDSGTILDVNRRACENLGYTREELIGQTIFIFDVHFSPEWLEQNVRPAMEAGETMTFETEHRRKDGSVFPVEIRARVFAHQGRTLNLCLTRDITERKHAEEEQKRLRQLESDLAHINRVSMMGELAASVAHEVNQPLSGIVSNASASLRFLAVEPPDLQEVREAVRDIVRDGKRAGDVIARIRALTKRAATPREELDLNEVVLEVLAITGDEARRKGVNIRTQLADDLPTISGDRVQLQQVLLNLIINAFDAMSEVDDRVRELLIVTAKMEPDQVQLTIQDAGTGMDPATISKVFEPFYTTKAGGMGMGLSISRSIIQHHGGRLWATANDGPGTSFHFALPRYGGQMAVDSQAPRRVSRPEATNA